MRLQAIYDQREKIATEEDDEGNDNKPLTIDVLSVFLSQPTSVVAHADDLRPLNLKNSADRTMFLNSVQLGLERLINLKHYSRELVANAFLRGVELLDS